MVTRRNSKKSKKVIRPRAKPPIDLPSIEGPDFSKVPAVPRIFGYIRVSREDQNLDMQRQAMDKFGCDRVFEDKLSGRTDRRDGYKSMIKHTQPEDTVVVYAMSRLFRNSRQIEDLILDFNERNITLVTLTEHINIKSIHGRIQAKMLAAWDQGEVEKLAERTKHGMAAKKANGAVFGRPRVVSPAQIKQMKKWHGKLKAPIIAARMHCSTATVYKNW